MWVSTWPRFGRPTYAEHATEAQAAAHAQWLVDSDTTQTATYFEISEDRP